MKYEAVFGDQSLFFDAHRDCEMVGNGHHKVENGKLMVWNFSEKCWCNSHTNTITISAMRRIIAEPKRWTVEDQKAGQLPEVGCRVVLCFPDGYELHEYMSGWESGDEIEILRLNGNIGVAAYNRGAFGCANVSIRHIKPIETPEEKAQREEDEFVDSLRSVEIHGRTVGGYLNQGARAAYRKLKGGE